MHLGFWHWTDRYTGVSIRDVAFDSLDKVYEGIS